MELKGHQRSAIMIDLNTSTTLLGSLILRNKLETGPGASQDIVAAYTSFLIPFVFPRQMISIQKFDTKNVQNLNYESGFPLGTYSPDVYSAE